eukprot:scaffold173178_cov26-Tisochrysis_lutea.AAC.3
MASSSHGSHSLRDCTEPTGMMRDVSGRSATASPSVLACSMGFGMGLHGVCLNDVESNPSKSMARPSPSESESADVDGWGEAAGATSCQSSSSTWSSGGVTSILNSERSASSMPRSKMAGMAASARCAAASMGAETPVLSVARLRLAGEVTSASSARKWERTGDMACSLCARAGRGVFRGEGRGLRGGGRVGRRVACGEPGGGGGLSKES